MADKTHIEWTDATWNPVTGCSKVSQGCKHCYAERDWPRLSANKGTRYFGRAFTDVMEHHELLDVPLRWTKPRRIFVNSMSDLFHPDVSDQFIADVFAYMAYARQHTFQVLTKRPERMVQLLTSEVWLDDCYHSATTLAHDDACEVLGRRGEFDANCRRTDDIRAFNSSFPLANVWLGVSVEDQAAADERIPLLLKTPAAVRWISAEPLLGQINVGPYLSRTNMPGLRMMPGFRDPLPGIDWVVSGGESGAKARPSHPDWFRLLRDQCAAAGVAYLHKQNGEWVSVSEVAGPGPHYTFPDGATVRRTGKALAGRTIDGVIHDAYPEVRP